MTTYVVWCHDCNGEGCDYCEGTGQVIVDDEPYTPPRANPLPTTPPPGFAIYEGKHNGR